MTGGNLLRRFPREIFIHYLIAQRFHQAEKYLIYDRILALIRTGIDGGEKFFQMRLTFLAQGHAWIVLEIKIAETLRDRLYGGKDELEACESQDSRDIITHAVYIDGAVRYIYENIAFLQSICPVLEDDRDFSLTAEKKAVPVHFENTSLCLYFVFRNLEKSDFRKIGVVHFV